MKAHRSVALCKDRKAINDQVDEIHTYSLDWKYKIAIMKIIENIYYYSCYLLTITSYLLLLLLQPLLAFSLDKHN
jgi:hypothetical protein